MINIIKTKNLKSVIIFLSCLFLFSNSFSQNRSRSLLFRTETKIIHSNIVGEDYEIYISFPADYFQNDTTTYPVLYSTDGNYGFNLVSSIANILSFPGKEIPGVLVVGIGYRIKGLEDWMAWRSRDLTPTKDTMYNRQQKNFLSHLSGRNDFIVNSGDATKFLEFIREELIPYIESSYRVKKNDRALFGYSQGGIFTLFSVFKSTGTFQRYYAGSPGIQWDNKVLFKYEKGYAESHKDLPVKLFMSFGSLENPSAIANMNEMAAKLKSRNYPNLKLETHLFEGETHSSGVAGGISRALKIIYND